ncbi:DNA mismatch repair endonuclease MutL [Paenibacillus glycanilyticus]|uniref:DNA mismatch repair endonuclease MutL n=1 Tax=Paenibacillus glycanilyticus TaxID=126569 RepID=UPI0020403CA6|nr:DNA mismatch repair endonuclease MutL [Paenibacillus glycanilyticus]MCM3627598.1 DNA mismatch repair endonuclease MutL [Paenibacillus glycanilyticus]
MGKIQVLDEQLANQIAAGEVVERPASVIKELVENAIDAGSSVIDITIEEGGLSFIRVTDNGSGIEPGDMETAFQRHATSKISSSSDLFKIASLGFRGEALPSIAAVSRLECVSSMDSTGLAQRLSIEGGTVMANEPANAPQGTDMSVRDLFYNTPARLKYMKAIQTELGHITDYVYRIALAHPGIAITLKHNGSVLLRTLGTGDRLQVIAAVYGTNTAKAMLKVEGETSDYDLRGYISKPELTRANRNGMTVIVNGRYIRSHAVNQAILQAYHTLLPINRFPIVVLEIGMHPSLLDVNVHPSKMEVRFSKENELRTLVEQAVKEALGQVRHIPGPAEKKEREKPLFVQDAISFHRPDPMTMPWGQDRGSSADPNGAGVSGTGTASSGSSFAASKPTGSPAAHTSSAYSSYSSFPQPPKRDYVPKDATERLYKPAEQREISVREAAAPWEQAAPALQRAEESAPPPQLEDADASVSQQEQGERLPEGTTAFPELYWIGQLHGTYIVAQAEEGLYLIDQHAAHERINYEYYYQKFGNPQAASQQLLVPLTLEFTSGEAEQLRGMLDLFREAGVELESFGPQTFLVRAYPEWFPQGEEQAIIEEMAELLLSERKSIHIAKLREKAAIMCSCKASIKANDRKTREEGEVLLARLAACNQPYTCPHGRPIVVHISTYQLEKMFKRVMS